MTQLQSTKKYISAFYVDDIEMLQASLNYASELANDASYQLSNLIDTAVLENTNTIGVSALGISGSDYVTGQLQQLVLPL